MKQACDDEIRPVYAVVGADRFLRQAALDRILHGLADEPDAFGPARFDGSQADAAEVLDEVRTMSLLGGRRVVIVDDADAFITANRTTLERYAAAPADSGTLILVCQTLPKPTRLYKAIQENGAVVHCAAPKGRAVVDWIADRARSAYQKRLGRGAAASLREHVGDSLGGLDGELAKLSAYVGQRAEITPADIDALTGNNREEKVFAVTDAMSAGDIASAMAHWEQVMATDRAAPGRAISGLAWGVRRLLEARREWKGGVSIRQLATKMFTDPAKLQRRLESQSIDQLEGQLRDLLAADLAVKTSASQVGLAVEKFIVKHAAGRVATN